MLWFYRFENSQKTRVKRFVPKNLQKGIAQVSELVMPFIFYHKNMSVKYLAYQTVLLVDQTTPISFPIA